jgi:hypothetical protein
MSFRSSRSHTKPVAPPRRRSSSLTRASGATNSYQTSANGRPFSIHGSSIGTNLNFPSSSSSSSQGNYMYGSNQNLRGGSDYYRSPYTSGVTNGALKYPSSSASSYSSPYKDRYAQSYKTNGSGASSSYTSAYKDRGYYNPYTSYDNGVTTASLSIPGINSRSSNLLSTSTSGLGGSNSNLMNSGQAIVNLGRSQSLREHERKNRSRKCKEAAKVAVPDSAVPYEASSLSSAQKSLSSLSLQSEGYEVRVSMCRNIFLYH